LWGEANVNALLANVQRFLPHRAVLGIAERSVRSRNSTGGAAA
jgi:hypothetical protein